MEQMCLTCGLPLSVTEKCCRYCRDRLKKNRRSFYFWRPMAIFLVLSATYLACAATMEARETVGVKTAVEIAYAQRYAAVIDGAELLRHKIPGTQPLEWVKILTDENGTLLCFVYRTREGVRSADRDNARQRTAILQGVEVGWNDCDDKPLYDMTHAKRDI